MKGLFANRQALSPPKQKIFPGYLAIPGFPVNHETTQVSPETSAALLCSTSPRLWKASAAHVERLADALDYIPLGLYVAGRLLHERWYWSYERYLKTLTQEEKDLPVGSPDFSKNSSLPQNRRLMAALMLTYKLLENASKTATLARTIFLTAGYCETGRPIPVQLVAEAVHGSGTPDKLDAALNAALNRLYDLGLLRWSENGPIILDVAAELAARLDDKEESGLKRLVNAGLKICEEETARPDRMELLDCIAPHLERAAEAALAASSTGAAGAQHNLPARIYKRLGYAYWSHFEPKIAQRCFEHALQHDEHAFGPMHGEVAADCSLLGRVLSETGEAQGAKDYFLRSIGIMEKTFSRESPSIAEDSIRLGKLLHDTGDLHGALLLYERALGIHEKSYEFGPRHPNTGNDLFQLGLVFYDMGVWEEAKRYFERALEIHEWLYGPYHHTVHADLTYLGKTLRAGGQLNEAKDFFERVLVVEHKIADNRDYNDPSTLNNLGLILQDMGQLEEAKLHFERALRIDEETLGPDHPNVARDANNLGCVLRDMNDLPAARILFQRAIDINQAARGPDHRDVAINISNLGRVLFALEDLNGAREAFARVLEIDEKLKGPDHLDVANDCANLGTALHELAELDAARGYYERALAIYEKQLPQNHPKRLNLEKSLERLK
jgi:tetratricopeptide (TPR) repeat protein